MSHLHKCHILRRPLLHLSFSHSSSSSRRRLTTLAIETSCDDTAVAVLSRDQRSGGRTTWTLLFNERIASDNRPYGGINPSVAVQSHNASLAGLVRRALDAAAAAATTTSTTASGEKWGRKWVPDLVCATRGPGIMSNLAVGLNMAKGLAVAWDTPFMAVHHMQAHALTPRLVSALNSSNKNNKNNKEAKEDACVSPSPSFPFLSLLVSGGHTQLIHSTSLTKHHIVATTGDVAIGNLLDQAARVILPQEILQSSPDVMYGRVLESFAFPTAGCDSEAHDMYEAFFQPAASRYEEMQPLSTGYDWSIPLPLRDTRKLAYSFSSIRTHVDKIALSNPSMTTPERRALARHTLRAAFQHLVGRLILALQDRPPLQSAKTLVVAGGVASNRFLMHVLRTTLAARGFPDLEIIAPPPHLCTDNAAMIAWAGVEMYEAGWCSDLSVLPIGKWPMDPETGPGILGVGGWLRRHEEK